METIQFIHMTDTHMNAPGQSPWDISMSDKVKQIFQDVKASEYKPAFIVITGDLTKKAM